MQYIPEEFGKITEVRCRNSTEDPKITITFSDNSELSYTYNEDQKIRKDIKSISNLYYLTAARFGPRVSLPTSIEKNNVGICGENVYSVLSYFRESRDVPQILRHKSAPHLSGVFEQVRAWLSIVASHINFDFETYNNVDRGTGIFNDSRPTNVGFGISYTLPIFVQVISLASIISLDEIQNAIVLIENPEAHLHPQGQTQLGKFLALASKCGIQMIVETHSEHILNGIRLVTKDNIISDNDVIFHYFFKNPATENTEINTIFVNKDGMLDSWPVGFFDEYEKNLKELLL